MSSIGPVVTEEKIVENVDGRRMDGRLSHWYTISWYTISSLNVSEKLPVNLTHLT